MVISGITGNTINLASALLYDHYGDPGRVATINGDMDMRSTVAVLDRNIKIIGSGDSWGG